MADSVSLYHTATEYVANSLTFSRGSASDVTSVGVYHTTDPADIPAVSDFTIVTLVQPGDPLAEGQNIDVLSLIGPGVGADLSLTAGDYQRFVLIETSTEQIIRRPDVISVI